MFERLWYTLKKRFLDFLLRRLSRNNENTELIKKGWLRVGNNVDMDGLAVEIRNPIGNPPYIVIGDDCILKGKFLVENKGSIIVGRSTFIGGSTLIANELIEIGNDVLISWGCTLIDTNAHSLLWVERQSDVKDWRKGMEEDALGKYKKYDVVETKKILVKDRSWIGFNSIILKGVTIGEEAVIGAGSVVSKDVLKKTVVAGNPARVIKSISDEV